MSCDGLIDKDKIRQGLEWFVERVRKGYSIDGDLLRYIADGVERHLHGKEAWPTKRGVRKLSFDAALARYLPMWAEYQRIMDASYAKAKPIRTSDGRPGHRLPVNREGAISQAAENLGVDESTVKRALAFVEGRLTPQDRIALNAALAVTSDSGEDAHTK